MLYQLSYAPTQGRRLYSKQRGNQATEISHAIDLVKHYLIKEKQSLSPARFKGYGRLILNNLIYTLDGGIQLVIHGGGHFLQLGILLFEIGH